MNAAAMLAALLICGGVDIIGPTWDIGEGTAPGRLEVKIALGGIGCAPR